MNKKTKKLLFICCEVVFAVAAFCMLFVPAVGIKDAEETFSGMNVTFGYSEKVLIAEVKVLEFSFMNLLTYIFAVAAAVLAVLKLFVKDSKVITLVVAALLIVAGVFFFLTVQFTIVNSDATKVVAAFGANVKDALTLGIGSILGGVFALLGGATACCEFFLAKE